MTEKLYNILYGAGTLASIFPQRRRKKEQKLYHPAKSAAEALRSDWERLGVDMRKSALRVMNER